MYVTDVTLGECRAIKTTSFFGRLARLLEILPLNLTKIDAVVILLVFPFEQSNH